jgi:hypothetical protein
LKELLDTPVPLQEPPVGVPLRLTLLLLLPLSQVEKSAPALTDKVETTISMVLEVF